MPDRDDADLMIDAIFGPPPEWKRCINCGGEFDPSVEGTYWWTCSEDCSREAADTLNNQKGLD